MELHLGDSLDVLKGFKDNSVDSVVCDPPYGLKFMNKKWDYDVPSIELWQQVLRVLKPGGHLLSFGGTRTYHRMVVNIEDAGFEIRDQIQWLYGSGFPKSHNISKGIDKKFGTLKEIEYDQGGGYGNGKFKNSNVSDTKKDGFIGKGKKSIANSDLAKQYDGYGTALKPANEPICLARKPLSEKTIVDNVLKWGTGGINIDGCRVEATSKDLKGMERAKGTNIKSGNFVGGVGEYIPPKPNTQGRFPANILLDERAAEMLDEQSGILKSGAFKEGQKTKESNNNCMSGKNYPRIKKKRDSSEGYASRFFYCAKASKSERNAGLEGMELKLKTSKINKSNGTGERFDGAPTSMQQNHHPTVKPLKLMIYLTKLITPQSGICLDPFMGSGTTGIACKNNGFNFIGIELDKEYYDIAKRRIDGQLNP